MRTPRCTAVAVASLLIATACSAPVEPSSTTGGLVLPERFLADASGAAGATDADTRADLDLWWRRLGDDRLGEAVEEALRFNRELLAAAARVDVARARAELAGASLSPSLTARLDAQRRRFNFIGLPIGGSDVFSVTTNQHTLALDLSWELDLWGRVRAGETAAEHDVEAASADLRGAAHAIAGRTSKAWIACVEAAQQLRLAEATAASRTRTEEMVRRRFTGGVRPALDLHLARADREAAEALVLVRQRARDAAVRALQVLLGRYPGLALDPGTSLPSAPPPVPAGLPATLLRRRPDLAAAERRLAAADQRVGEAKADRWPRVALTASGGTSSNDLTDLVDLDFRQWSLGANLLAPIFDGGRRSTTIELRDAERRESEARFAVLLLAALAEVEGALANASTLAAEETSLAGAAAQARAAATLSADRYARGLSDITTLLDAERRALAADTALLGVRRARLENHIELLLALGGGIPPAAASDDRP